MKFFFCFFIFISVGNLAHTLAGSIKLPDLREKNKALSDDQLIRLLIEEEADFSKGDLTGLHLKDREVIRSLFESNRSFVGSNLSNVKLEIAEGEENLKLHGDFTSAIFYNVQFPKGTDFTLAILNKTKFIHSNIEESSFAGMKLEGTSFENFTDLERVNFGDALLKRVQFVNDVKIRNSNFKNTQLVEVKFSDNVFLYDTNLLESQPRELELSDVFLSYDELPAELLSKNEKEGLENMGVVNSFLFFINMETSSLRGIFQKELKTSQGRKSITEYWVTTPRNKLSEGDFLALKNFIMEQVLKIYALKRLSLLDLDQLGNFLEQLVNVKPYSEEIQKISDWLDNQKVNIFGRFKELSFHEDRDKAVTKIPLISLEVEESMNQILNKAFYLERLGKEISLKQVLEQEFDAEIRIGKKDEEGVDSPLYVVTILIPRFRDKLWYETYFYESVYETVFYNIRGKNADKIIDLQLSFIRHSIRTFKKWKPEMKNIFVRRSLGGERENRVAPVRQFIEWEKEEREKVLEQQNRGKGKDVEKCAKIL